MLEFDRVLERLPTLKNLLDSYGSMSLFDYASKHYIVTENISPIAQKRKEEFLDFLDEYVTRKFGQKSAEIVIGALSRNYAVSTAEHHGPMGHPFFFQSVLLRAITQPDLPVINFATSHVSLGNSSYPRGIVFHGDTEKAPKEYLHLPFFGSKSRMCPVFDFPAYTRDDIETHCIERLKSYRAIGYVTEPLYVKIYDFIQEDVLDASILVLHTYSEQITQFNHTWWSKLFPKMPEYISLDAEDLIVELLKKHLHEKSFFGQLLTDNALQPRIEAEFDGISCCFDRETGKGTYLFWYLDEHHRRHALWREGDELVSSDKSFRMKMTSEEYVYHLKEHHLIPSGLLVYTMFACYYGVTCFGGIFQGEYLPKISNSFQQLFPEESGFGGQYDIVNADLYFLFDSMGRPVTGFDQFTPDMYIHALQNTLSLRDSLEKCFIDL